MKALLFFFSFISFVSFSSINVANDTISNWQLYINNELVQSFNLNSEIKKIVLTKGKIKSQDTLSIVYSDCTKCIDCISFIELRLKDNTLINKISPKINSNEFRILTTQLQMAAFRYRSNRIYFIHKTIKEKNEYDTLLFYVEIK